LFCKSRGVRFARFHISENRTHRVGLFQLHRDLRNFAFTWRRHAHHRFIGFDVYNFLVIRDFIARLYFDIDDCGFGDRLAKLRHDDWDLRHKFLESVLRSCARFAFIAVFCSFERRRRGVFIEDAMHQTV
jgi:hypothetical protein